jgi:aspartate racemase
MKTIGLIGGISDDSRAQYRQVIAGLVAAGAEGIVLGCTEIGLLVSAVDSPVPLFDTTAIHARAAVDQALGRDIDPAPACQDRFRITEARPRR